MVSMVRRSGVLSLGLLALCACGDDGEPGAPTAAQAEQAAASERGAPRGGHAAADPTPELPPSDREEAPAQTIAVAAADDPAAECEAVGEAVRVLSSAGPAAVAAVSGGFAVAAYTGGPQEEVFVVRVPASGRPAPLARVAVSPALRGDRVAPPALVSEAPGRLALALVDGDGKLFVGRLAIDRPGPPAMFEAAASVDPRFAPAAFGLERGLLLAWTDSAARGMRVKAAVVDRAGQAVPATDLTPSGMGAAAPVFAAGPSTPELYFLDARAGVSPLWAVSFDAAGTPAAAEVARPLGIAPTPPEIAVAQVRGATLAGHTVVGNAATTAVGVVPLAGDRPVSALVAGTGYGQLHVAAASVEGVAVFAADAPQAPDRNAAREIHLRRVDQNGNPGGALVIRGPEGAASHAALAAQDGTIALVFTGRAGVYLQRVRCPR